MMERIFFVKNGDLREINEWLQKGGRVKFVQPVTESVSAYGYTACEMCCSEQQGSYKGDIYAYVVVEFN